MDDFGFTFSESNDEVKASNQLSAETIMQLTMELKKQKDINTAMYKRITVLLHNLRRDPDKPMINWPNRAEKIDAFIEELDKIRKGTNE